MEEAKLLDEIGGLKWQLYKNGRAIARIVYWHDRVGLETREGVEWKTLEKVLRIFKEEGAREEVKE